MRSASTIKTLVLALSHMMAVGAALSAAAQPLALGSPFGDGMVLQRAMPVPVWGWASPGETVTVEFKGQKKTAVAGQDGTWRVTLDPLPTGKEPAALAASAASGKVELKDVLVGEVWFCSGQSNMAMPLRDVLDAQAHIEAADLPTLRLVSFDPVPAGLAQARAARPGQWQTCSPRTAGGWSAVAFFYGRELVRKLDVPVGLIVVATGATPIEFWVPRVGLDITPELAELAAEARALDEAYRQELAAWEAGGKAGDEPVHPYVGPRTLRRSELEKNPRRALGAFHNGSVAPLVGTAMRGMTWYQGESNRGDTSEAYFTLHKALVSGLRKAWGIGDFPFHYVQISALESWRPGWHIAEIWDGQTRVLQLPNTGMAVIHDLCEDIKNIHPKNKQGVGERLALWSLAKTYGFADLPYAGPIYTLHAVEGNRVRIRFDYTFGELKSRDGKPLDWFTITGADGQFVPAQAEVDKDTVLVWSEQVAAPTHVQFAWDGKAQPNLVNGAGLPASPFRTNRTW